MEEGDKRKKKQRRRGGKEKGKVKEEMRVKRETKPTHLRRNGKEKVEEEKGRETNRERFKHVPC